MIKRYKDEFNRRNKYSPKTLERMFYFIIIRGAENHSEILFYDLPDR